MPEQFPDFDLYEELEVSPHASAEVIRAAYHRLAWLHHPDLSLGADTGRMGRLNLAYEILNDPLKRADYDRWRHPLSPTPTSSGPTSEHSGKWNEPVADSIWLDRVDRVSERLSLAVIGRILLFVLFGFVIFNVLPGSCAHPYSQSTFTSNQDGDYEIFTLKVASSGGTAGSTDPKQLTNNDNDDWAAVLSPHGNRIAFTSNRDGDYEIFVMDLDGTNLQQLTDNDDFDSSPAWSPDGSRITFMSDRNGDYEIFIMDADGTNQNGPGTNWR